MKTNIHPKYQQITITCGCGNSFVVGSTLDSLHVDICSNCHPFFTGDQRFVDTLGKVDKFMAKRQAAGSYTPKKATKRTASDETKRLSLKEMLTVTKTV